MSRSIDERLTDSTTIGMHGAPDTYTWMGPGNAEVRSLVDTSALAGMSHHTGVRSALGRSLSGVYIPRMTAPLYRRVPDITLDVINVRR